MKSSTNRTRTPVVVGPPRRRLARGEQFLVGAEIGPAVVRASVFNRRRELLGKMKLSAKLERGEQAVLERIQRCIRYAVDEADLRLGSIRAIGLAVAEGALAGTGGDPDSLARARAPLEAGLGRRVFVGDQYSLAALAIRRLEAADGRGDLGVFFPGAVLGVRVVTGQGTECYDPDSGGRGDAGQGVRRARKIPLPRVADRRFESFRPRDFRKAVRRGDAEARAFVLRSVERAMHVAADLVRAGTVKRLVIAGGAVDENREEALAAARRRLARELGAGPARRIRITMSDLGDQASLLGAALRASEPSLRLRRPRPLGARPARAGRVQHGAG